MQLEQMRLRSMPGGWKRTTGSDATSDTEEVATLKGTGSLDLDDRHSTSIAVVTTAPPPSKGKPTLSKPAALYTDFAHQEEERDVVTPLHRGIPKQHRMSAGSGGSPGLPPSVGASQGQQHDAPWQVDHNTVGTHTPPVQTQRTVTAADILTGAVPSAQALNPQAFKHTPLSSWLAGHAAMASAAGAPGGGNSGASPRLPDSATKHEVVPTRTSQTQLNTPHHLASPGSAASLGANNSHSVQRRLSSTSGMGSGSPSRACVMTPGSAGMQTPTSRPPLHPPATASATNLSSAGQSERHTVCSSPSLSRTLPQTALPTTPRADRPQSPAASGPSSHKAKDAMRGRAPPATTTLTPTASGGATNPYGFAQVLFGQARARATQGPQHGGSRSTMLVGASLGASGSGLLPRTGGTGPRLGGQSTRSKVGSASSRMALSGLLSRGSNMGSASTDRSTMSLDFRPRWR